MNNGYYEKIVEYSNTNDMTVNVEKYSVKDIFCTTSDSTEIQPIKNYLSDELSAMNMINGGEDR